MRYPPRRGPANYSHPDFVPIFLDEQPSDVLQAARATCGDAVACIYDYVATGSAAMASASKDTAEKADEREKISSELVYSCNKVCGLDQRRMIITLKQKSEKLS